MFFIIAVADYEEVVNFAAENIKVSIKTYSTAEYCTRIAGVLAGLPLNQSATYYARTVAQQKLSDLSRIKESFSFQIIEAIDSYTRAGYMITIDDLLI